ncbi:MAG: DUF86 domain-containing protein [Desulfotomaculaceae bacterium]
MKKELAFFEDILKSMELIERYLENKSEEDFMYSQQVQDAVVRRLEIIGEAAKRITNETKEKYPQIPWRQITGMRDIIAHEYDGIDYGIVWNTCEVDLPELKEKLLSIFNKIKG